MYSTHIGCKADEWVSELKKDRKKEWERGREGEREREWERERERERERGREGENRLKFVSTLHDLVSLQDL